MLDLVYPTEHYSTCMLKVFLLGQQLDWQARLPGAAVCLSSDINNGDSLQTDDASHRYFSDLDREWG